MADAEDLKYAEVRGRILDAVRKNLIGPMEPEESIRERPTITYITGMLYPTDSAEVDMAEDYTEPSFPEAEEQQGDGELEAPIIEEDESEPVQKGRFKKTIVPGHILLRGGECEVAQGGCLLGYVSPGETQCGENHV